MLRVVTVFLDSKLLVETGSELDKAVIDWVAIQKKKNTLAGLPS
jgi:hypothetical protein